MKILSVRLFSLLVALASTAPALADQYYQPSQYGVNQVTVCSDSIIQVEDVSILCDSPGAYYYGSGKYRNSASCKPGDKAKIVVDFYIADEETIEYAGGYALASIEVDGSYSQIKTVQDDADLCSLDSLKSLSGNGCPGVGYYQIREQFYWDKAKNSYNSSAFFPTVTVGFRSSANQYSFDYGGANTDLCRGSTFVTWTKRVRKTYANALSNFIKTFGILLSTIAMMGAFIWCLVHKPKNLADAKAKLVPNERQDDGNDNVFDFRKLPTGANSHVQLVDF
eukprot:scaffold2783_cov129-Cylindrotheca_fusiformis.AAC.18